MTRHTPSNRTPRSETGLAVADRYRENLELHDLTGHPFLNCSYWSCICNMLQLVGVEIHKLMSSQTVCLSISSYWVLTLKQNFPVFSCSALLLTTVVRFPVMYVFLTFRFCNFTASRKVFHRKQEVWLFEYSCLH